MSPGIKALFIIAIIALAGGLTYSIYYGYQQTQKLTQELTTNQQQFASSTNMFQEKIANLENGLAKASNENDDLRNQLNEERDRNNEFAGEINKIAKTVGVLDKLSKTDKELLQKYSKIYFLNEHYIPENLTDINTKYLLPADKKLQIHTKVSPFLDNLLQETEDGEIDLKIVSAYRSFGTQASLKSTYKVTYGAGTANQFSADQGYSEHQLGTTVDFATSDPTTAFISFEKTEAYKWLLNNAYKFGFIISYPTNNAYYQFEPWHWRFVGQKLARDLKNDGNYFYDMDQRDIDKYLINIFD